MDNKKLKIAFLDRDGVINKNAAEHCYITKVEEFVFNEEIFGILLDWQKQGYEFIVITNQRGVARGQYSEEDLGLIHQYMQEEFNKRGIKMLDIFYCPHQEDSCSCRKPKPGMLEQACEKYEIDLANSILISDSKKDVEMGKQFGVGQNILVEQDKPRLRKV